MRVTGALHDGPTQLHYCDENVDVISLHSNRIRTVKTYFHPFTVQGALCTVLLMQQYGRGSITAVN